MFKILSLLITVVRYMQCHGKPILSIFNGTLDFICFLVHPYTKWTNLVLLRSLFSMLWSYCVQQTIIYWPWRATLAFRYLEYLSQYSNPSAGYSVLRYPTKISWRNPFFGRYGVGWGIYCTFSKLSSSQCFFFPLKVKRLNKRWTGWVCNIPIHGEEYEWIHAYEKVNFITA